MPPTRSDETPRLVAVAFVIVAFVAERFVNIPEFANTDAPVAFVKFNVVTVEEPATNVPVNASVVPDAFVIVAFVALSVVTVMTFDASEAPVAFVKFNVVTVEDPALNDPVSESVVPDAFVNVVFWSWERPET